MQDFYLRNQTFTGQQVEVQLTFAGTLFHVSATICMFVGTTLYPFIGFRALLSIGIFLTMIGLISAGFATEVWHLYLSISICTGCGLAFQTVVGLLLIPGWFSKYISTANGIYHSVFFFANIILPFLMVRVNNTMGPRWSFFIIGIVAFVSSIAVFPFIKERDSTDRKNKLDEVKKNGIVDWSLFRNMNLVIWFTIGPIQMVAEYITFVFAPLYSTYIGLSDIHGATIISILSSFGFLGTVSGGILADKFGSINILIISMVIASISAMLVWMFAYTFSTMIIYAILGGLVNTMYYTVASPITLYIAGPEKYPAALGLKMVPFLFTLAGPTIASYLDISNRQEPFLYVKIFCGAAYMISGLLLLVLKLRMQKKLFAKI
ncbi:major facilitator superfamily domain-containing protein [Phascolomyces articulosus]|uniref:Major facilitator superfamily domain-containing protein n=1 Tax=Phascolomyces articulosus TaxID=60185 RepID=A0AAD5JW37_9FUNG|nr:major facilitator superfamily domain-containing protein [Phascolomyces articulosus]